MILPIKSTLIDQKIAALGFLVLLFWLIQEMLVRPSEFACQSEQLLFYKKNNSFSL